MPPPSLYDIIYSKRQDAKRSRPLVTRSFSACQYQTPFFFYFIFLFFRIKNFQQPEINSMPLSKRNLPSISFAVDGGCCRNLRRAWTTAILPCPIKRRGRTMRKTLRCCEFHSSMLLYSCSFASTRLFAPNSITFVAWRKRRRRWRTSRAVADK